LLRNITVSPLPALTGLGWNAPFPLELTMATVTVRAAAGGVAGAAGEGDVGGLADPPPQPHNTTAPAAASVRTKSDCRIRMVLRRPYGKRRAARDPVDSA
jgi:hypothetical protein